MKAFLEGRKITQRERDFETDPNAMFKICITIFENIKNTIFLIIFSIKSLLGLDKVIKKLWTIINSSKKDEKEKIKPINLIIQCYKEKFEMIKSELELIDLKRHMKNFGSMICN